MTKQSHTRTMKSHSCYQLWCGRDWCKLPYDRSDVAMPSVGAPSDGGGLDKGGASVWSSWRVVRGRLQRSRTAILPKDDGRRYVVDGTRSRCPGVLAARPWSPSGRGVAFVRFLSLICICCRCMYYASVSDCFFFFLFWGAADRSAASVRAIGVWLSEYLGRPSKDRLLSYLLGRGVRFTHSDQRATSNQFINHWWCFALVLAANGYEHFAHTHTTTTIGAPLIIFFVHFVENLVGGPTILSFWFKP